MSLTREKMHKSIRRILAKDLPHEELVEALDRLYDQMAKTEYKLAARGEHADAKIACRKAMSYTQKHAVIVGELKGTIKAHGPITNKYISSAAKRIAGGLFS